MKKYYTTTEIVESLDALIVGDDITSEEVEMFEEACVRLKSQSDHIDWMRSRLALAEHVIGELYLMQREYES